jgi:hypothetical protein
MPSTPSSSRRAAPVALALLLATGAFLYAAPRAFAADDKSTFGSLLDMFGVSSDETADKVDYRERSRLVVPPNPQSLPEPRAGEAAGGSWPVDHDVARRRAAIAGARAPAPQPGLNQNPTLRPDQLAGKSRDGDRAPGDSDCLNARNSRECLLMSAEEAKKGTTSDNRTLVKAGEEPSRAFLTEPPTGYRRPTKDISATTDPQEKVDLSNPLTYLRSQANKVIGGGN